MKLAATLGKTVANLDSFVVFLGFLIESGYYRDARTPLDFDADEYRKHAVDVHHRWVCLFDGEEDDDDASSDCESLEDLEEEDEDESAKNPRTPVANKSNGFATVDFQTARMTLDKIDSRKREESTAKKMRPDVIVTEEGLSRLRLNSYYDEFADELYTTPGGTILEKPTAMRYMQPGWLNHPEVYAARFEAVASNPKYAPLFEDVSDELSSRFSGPSEGEVRRHIEKHIFIRSEHRRNFPQKMWANWFRAHHTPKCVRELFEVYGDAVTYNAICEGLKQWDFVRDAGMIDMIANFVAKPSSLSLVNSQKGYLTKVTSSRETSKYVMMTDMSAAFCDVPTRDHGGVGSISRTPGFPMTLQADFGGDKEDEEFCDCFEIPVEWLKTFARKIAADPELCVHGLAGGSYLTAGGCATHSGRFGISQKEHFGVGAFQLHPDRDVDTVLLLLMTMVMFAEIWCPSPGPYGIPFVVPFCLDQKCYDNVRKAIGHAKSFGSRAFDPIFPVPDHWHATQAAGFAAVLNGIGWRFFRLYRQSVHGGKYKSDLTTDHFSRSMNFTVMYRHLRIIKLGWICVREECIAKLDKMKEAGEYIDPDLEAFVTWNDYITPIVYDLLQIVKHSAGPFYFSTALPHFIIVLHLRGRTLYSNAFDCYLRDLLRVRAKMPTFFWWFCSNLNRVVVCLHIEYQHKELAAFAEHLEERDANAIGPLICSLPAIRDANVHAASYKGLLKPEADGCSLASQIHDEHHAISWAATARTQFDQLASAKAMTGHMSVHPSQITIILVKHHFDLHRHFGPQSSLRTLENSRGHGEIYFVSGVL